MEFDKEWLKKNSFVESKTIKDLIDVKCKSVPKGKGVYVVIYNGKEKPNFYIDKVEIYGKEISLEKKWVEGASIIYIGKSVTLQKRLKRYMKNAKNHYGGRLIWKIRGNVDDFLVYWKVLKDQDPLLYETCLIETFKKIYGQLPFANLRRNKVISQS